MISKRGQVAEAGESRGCWCGEWGINEVEYSMFVWPLQQQCKQQLQRCLQHVAMTMTVDVWRRLANTHTHTQSQPNADRHNTMHIKCLNDNSNISECTEKIGVGYLVKPMHKSAIQNKIESGCNNFNSNKIVLQKGATLNHYFPPIFRSVHCGSGINYGGGRNAGKAGKVA